MQTRVIPVVLAALAGAALTVASVPGHGADSDDVLHRVSGSVVKVEAGSSAASGFLWSEPSLVVTALHAVDGQAAITVSYVDRNGRITATSPARVERVLPPSDLVLLRLTQPQQQAPLRVSATQPRVKQQLDAVGFPLNIAGISNTEVKVRFGGNQLRSILPPKVLSKFGAYPSTTEEILNLEGNLVPGLSGAPILNSNGEVVGVVDGGLESGAIGISWGIPARFLALLAASDVRQLPGAPKIGELFSADLQAEVGEAQQLADESFVKLRSRSFEQLMDSADDQLGLMQLAEVYAHFDPMSFRYDIYQDAYSGATVVVPEGATLSDDGYFITASVGDPRMHVKFLVEDVEGEADAQHRSQLFEKQLVDPDDDPNLMAAPDPQWSYFQPMRAYGVLVNRKAIFSQVMTAFGPQPSQYFFETLASDGDTLLGVAAVDEDRSPPSQARDNACLQGYPDPQCAAVLLSLRNWAQMVLGVQFTTLPQQQFDTDDWEEQ